MFGYLRCDLQALPLVAGRTHRIGRKADCDLCLKVCAWITQPPHIRKHVLSSKPIAPAPCAVSLCLQ